MKLKNLFKNFWPIIVIFALTLIFFYPVLFQNKVPLPVDALVGAHVPWTEIVWEGYPAGVPIKNQEITDAFSQFYPWRSLVGEFWRVGKPPLWNPYMFAGTPFLATLHSAGLYPLNIVYLFFNDITAWTFLVYLQVLLSALFMCLFLRELNLTKNASILGSIAFAFSGYMIAWLEFATGGHAGLWLPLLLYLELKLVKTVKWQWIIPIALVFFFVFTAGDFQVPVYVCICYGLFGLNITRVHKVGLKYIIFIALAGVAGILLSLPQILPTFELFSNSIRKDDPYIEEYFYGIMHWEKLANFIWPDFFGNVVTRNYWGKFGYHEYLAFIGVIPLVFLVYSLVIKKMKYELFFWISFFISLLFLFPTPLAFLPFKLHIPALGTSSASRLLFFVDFSMAVLAAFGFSKWEKDPRKTPFKILLYFLLATLLIVVTLGGVVYYIRVSSDVIPQIVVNLHVAMKNMIPTAAVLGLLGILFLSTKYMKKLQIQKVVPFLILLLFFGEMFRFAWKNTPFSPKEFVFPETKIISFLKEKKDASRIAGGIPLNLFMPFGISSVEGYDPLYPRLNGEWFSLVNHGDLGNPSRRYGLVHTFESPLMDYANMEYVIDYKKNIYGGIDEEGGYARGVIDPRYESVFREGRIEVLKNTESLPRIWLSSHYKVIQDQDELVSELIQRDGEEKDIILLSSPVTLSTENTPLNYLVSHYARSPNALSFDVSTSQKAFAFVSESYDPGWRASVDGIETSIYRGNFLFQVIQIPQGKHTVRFIYDPQSFRMGLAVSIVTLLCLISFLLYHNFNYHRTYD